ncbi:MAG: helix-turn-helix transcriptional regulator [Pseudomonadales bacterium]|jgi:AraC-like DNA-binding protein/quercetin dioxygenase-like cupin family protein
MTRLRHNEPVPGLFDPRFAVVSLSIDYRNGHRLPFHDHSWAQVIYADHGVMQVSTHDTAWLVPPSRAIWVPADVAHSILMRGSVGMRTLYVAPTAQEWPETCRALELQPVLRELILHLVHLEALDPSLPAHARLVGVLADLIAGSENVPLTLSLPRDPRARALAERILEDPGCSGTLAELARNVGASLRTLQRLFRAETGGSVESWRRRARMQHSVVALSEGASVTEAALAAGYRSASAFISAFKQTFGVTPSRYDPAE